MGCSVGYKVDNKVGCGGGFDVGPKAGSVKSMGCKVGNKVGNKVGCGGCSDVGYEVSSIVAKWAAKWASPKQAL